MVKRELKAHKRPLSFGAKCKRGQNNATGLYQPSIDLPRVVSTNPKVSQRVYMPAVGVSEGEVHHRRTQTRIKGEEASRGPGRCLCRSCPLLQSPKTAAPQPKKTPIPSHLRLTFCIRDRTQLEEPQFSLLTHPLPLGRCQGSTEGQLGNHPPPDPHTFSHTRKTSPKNQKHHYGQVPVLLSVRECLDEKHAVSTGNANQTRPGWTSFDDIEISGLGAARWENFANLPSFGPPCLVSV